MKTDIFIARAECKWYTGEKTLPHNIGQTTRKRVKKILKSESKNPALNRKFMKNIDQVTIEPHEAELEKDKIKEGKPLMVRHAKSSKENSSLS